MDLLAHEVRALVPHAGPFRNRCTFIGPASSRPSGRESRELVNEDSIQIDDGNWNDDEVRDGKFLRACRILIHVCFKPRRSDVRETNIQENNNTTDEQLPQKYTPVLERLFDS